MFVLTLKQVLAHKMRFASTAFAVALGVTLMAGTLIFADTLAASFDRAVAEANEDVDAFVRAPSQIDLAYGEARTRIDASTTDVVLGVDGVESVATRVTGYAQLVASDGEAVGNQAAGPAFGYNWVAVDELNPFQIARGRAPRANDEIAIDLGSAKESGYDVGDQAIVLTKQAPQEFRIVGIAKFGSADSLAGATAVLFTDATAQAVLSSPGQVDGIAMTAAPGISQATLAKRIVSALPGRLEVLTGDALVAEDQASVHDQFGPFRAFLLVFAVVAVFVGALMINNTFSITVAQRTKQLAMLRAVGASRRQVQRSVLGEAATIAVVGSAAGLALGFAVARGLTALLSAVGFEQPDAPTVVKASSMVGTALVGISVTLVSASLPARRASRIPPIAALRNLNVDRSGSSIRRTAIGSILTGVGIASLLAGLGGAGIALVGLGAFVTFIGVAVLAPVLTRPTTTLLRGPLALRGMPGEMAVRNARRNPKRTARTASSLMIGVALVAFIAVVAASVKTSFAGSLETVFLGTHVVDSSGLDDGGGLSPDLADQLRSTPQVDVVVETRMAPALIGRSETNLSAFSSASIGSIFDLGTVKGRLSRLGDDGLAVTTEYATEQGWTLGSTVPVTFASGRRPFVVRALFDDSDEWVGDTFVDIAAFDAALPDELDFRIYARGDDGAIRAAASSYPTAEVLDKDTFLDRANGQIEVVLGVIYALLALAVVIALLGIANTLAMSISERTREIGLLRAVGMLRAQIRATIRWEAAIIALFGTLLGLTVGTVFGWASVRALESEGIDRLTMPLLTLVVVITVAGVAGASAALLPARRAARMRILDALASR